MFKAGGCERCPMSDDDQRDRGAQMMVMAEHSQKNQKSDHYWSEFEDEMHSYTKHRHQ